jgi:hypothetical protein
MKPIFLALSLSALLTTSALFAQDTTKWTNNPIDSLVTVTVPGTLEMQTQNEQHRIGAINAEAISFICFVFDNSAAATTDTSSLAAVYDHFIDGYLRDSKSVLTTQKNINNGPYSGRYVVAKMLSNGISVVSEMQAYILNGKAYALVIVYKETDTAKNKDYSSRFLQLMHIAPGAHQPYAAKAPTEWTVNKIDSLVSLTLPGKLKIQQLNPDLLAGMLQQETVYFTITRESDLSVETPNPARVVKIILDGWVEGYAEHSKVTVLEQKDIYNGLYLGRYMRGTVESEKGSYFTEVQVFFVNGGCAYAFSIAYPASMESRNKELRQQFLNMLQLAPGATQP